MLSIQKKFLFIHVPKTGGNSIQSILKQYSEDRLVTFDYQDGSDRFEVRNDNYQDITKHSNISQYKLSLERELYNSLFKFATIRNPWDMMISYYFSPHRSVGEWDRDKFVRLTHNVKTLRDYICESSRWVRKLRRKGLYPKILNPKIDGNIDCLIRFESLEADFKMVCEKLDIPYVDLPKRNVSERSHYSQYYDPELREIVGKKFYEEIKLGGYTFECT